MPKCPSCAFENPPETYRCMNCGSEIGVAATLLSYMFDLPLVGPAAK